MKVFVATSGVESVEIKYREFASDLANMLAKNHYKLIFGGISQGMSGKLYMTYKYEEEKVKAIVELHDAKNLENIEVDAYDVTNTTFERTKLLYESADVIIILPGGIGTLAELFSMIDENRQKNINKPIILFNFDNFYTPLLKYLTKLHVDNFITNEVLKSFNIVTDIKSLELFLQRLERRI